MWQARGWLMCGAAVLAAVTIAHAGTVYRWTDERGVVHFGDVPPPHVTYTTENSAPVRPPIAPGTTPAAVMAPPEAVAATTPGETPKAAAPTGPARVVIKDREEVGVGDSLQEFSGTVKNEGGTEAHDVMVAIRVVEPGQGEECVRDEIEVEPSTLAPGATGKFAAEIEHPCFRGPTETELRVEWD